MNVLERQRAYRIGGMWLGFGLAVSCTWGMDHLGAGLVAGVLLVFMASCSGR